MSCECNNGGGSLSRKKKGASSCHAKVTMAWKFLERFFCVVWIGRNLYRWASIECGTQHWYSGCQKSRVARLDVSSRGVGACLCTKTRGDPSKKGVITKHGRAAYEGWPGNYLANNAKARTQLPNWQRNAIGTLLASCSAKIFQNLAQLFCWGFCVSRASPVSHLRASEFRPVSIRNSRPVRKY